MISKSFLSTKGKKQETCHDDNHFGFFGLYIFFHYSQRAKSPHTQNWKKFDFHLGCCSEETGRNILVPLFGGLLFEWAKFFEVPFSLVTVVDWVCCPWDC